MQQNYRMSNVSNLQTLIKIDKFLNFASCISPKISEIVQFRKLSIFQKLRIQ